jgi:HEPN domain-containing protein
MTAKSNLPEVWFAKAEADLQAAELLLNTTNPLLDIVCYHAQQCAEKYLKGYLVARSVPFKFVHELAYLTRLCIEQEPEFSAMIDVASELPLGSFIAHSEVFPRLSSRSPPPPLPRAATNHLCDNKQL